jgi:hypothetical protein
MIHLVGGVGHAREGAYMRQFGRTIRRLAIVKGTQKETRKDQKGVPEKVSYGRHFRQSLYEDRRVKEHHTSRAEPWGMKDCNKLTWVP